MMEIDINRLVEWLGPEGAIAGLEASDLTVPELLELGRKTGLDIDSKTRRTLIAIEIVNSRFRRIDKTDDELLRMTHDQLRQYFEERKVSGSELTRLLEQFGVQARSEDKKHLLEFAAREISDLGMYQRVAKGKSSQTRK
jgi:hypothetical protein